MYVDSHSLGQLALASKRTASKPDFICGTESWLNSSIKNGEIFPTSFKVFRKDRETSTIGGGVFQISNEDL